MASKTKSSWVNEHGAIVEFSGTALAPCKDFYHVFVTPTEVDKPGQITFRSWKIVPPTRVDSHVPPQQITNTYDDFLHDDRAHSEIQRLCGENTLQYLIRIAEGQVDYFMRLPDDALKKIILKLDLVDIVRLGATCHKFRWLCSDEEVWEGVFRREVEAPVTPELEALAEKEGWKRLFFTNKLQLQMQLRRQKRHDHLEHHDQAFMTQQQAME